mmetsp:Transcript_19217/g.46112  ORF Transcript_19217/g.46112 Transcript_19217/m.46112 type:complete len:275 (-) Transcript_19217:77-901(-)
MPRQPAAHVEPLLERGDAGAVARRLQLGEELPPPLVHVERLDAREVVEPFAPPAADGDHHAGATHRHAEARAFGAQAGRRLPPVGLWVVHLDGRAVASARPPADGVDLAAGAREAQVIARLLQLGHRIPLAAARVVPLHCGERERGGRVRAAEAAADRVDPAVPPALVQAEPRRIPPRAADGSGALEVMRAEPREERGEDVLAEDDRVDLGAQARAGDARLARRRELALRGGEHPGEDDTFGSLWRGESGRSGASRARLAGRADRTSSARDCEV